MKKPILLLMLVAIIFSFVSCGSTGSDWTVYLYLCGSSLESKYGSGTNNLVELIEADMPKTARVIVQTGGAREWKNNSISSTQIERWKIENGKMEKIQTLPNANMGDEGTLSDFIKFGEKKYPAQKTALIFWDHGGGSVSGVCFDENYNKDPLSLNEIESALKHSKQKYEIIGFDACLMATYDTAVMLAPYGKYMVASQELESSGGWDYKALANSLTKQADGVEVGMAIADGFYQKSRSTAQGASTTLSLVDLARIPSIIKEFDSAMAELNQKISISQQSFDITFGKIVRSADDTEKFGGVNDSENYSNLIDMTEFSQNMKLDGLTEALKSAVLYKVAGSEADEAKGLSMYYPVNVDTLQIAKYQTVNRSASYKEYLEAYYTDIPKNIIEFKDKGSIASDGHFTVALEDYSRVLKAETYTLIFELNENDDIESIIGAGYSGEVFYDEKTKSLKDTFDGSVPSLNGTALYVSSTLTGEQSYSAPILLNGEKTNLRFCRAQSGYDIIGTWKGIDATGVSDKNMRVLKEGDIITPLYENISKSDYNITIAELRRASLALTEENRNIDAYLDSLYKTEGIEEKKEMINSIYREISESFKSLESDLSAAMQYDDDGEEHLRAAMLTAEGCIRDIRAAVAKLREA